MKITILGLSITSSWGNGHATTFRSLVRALDRRGHDVLFLERDVPWYAAHRDLPRPPYGRTALYGSLAELREEHAADVRDADAVVVGSYVPDGAAVLAWVLSAARGVRAFYDIDTPVTLAKLERGEHEYLRPDLVPALDVYLSFTGGRTLERLERRFGARRARPLYCSVDPTLYHPEATPPAWDLGYLGTYSVDRQPTLERLLLDAARAGRERFVVAGPQYPEGLDWPANVERIEHLPPAAHRTFYNAQRFTLNVTRADMIRAGWSPSVRLFEAAACGTPVISDWWDGLDEFFVPGREIAIARTAAETLALLRGLPDDARLCMGALARERILAAHTAAHRAEELERWLRLAPDRPARRPPRAGETAPPA
jgi:spore maturation protein CgeB